MPDLTIVVMQQCKSCSVSHATVGKYELFGLGSERTWPTCSCPAYKYGKNGWTDFGGFKVANPCKHIIEYQKSICGWHEQYSPEDQTEHQRKHMICPKCGGETEWVKVGV